MPGMSRLSPLVVDRSLAALCVLGQVVVVLPGEHPAPGPAAAAVSSAVGLVSGLAILLWRRRTEPVLLVVVLGYLVQALLVGPLLPVAVAVACFLVGHALDANGYGLDCPVTGYADQPCWCSSHSADTEMWCQP